MRPLLLLSLLTLATGCVHGNLVSGALVMPMRVPVIGEPSLPHENFEVTTTDGIALFGWRFAPESQPRGVLVLVHGKDINRQHFVAAAQRFVKQGFAVVAYDQRAHGESKGEFITYGVREAGDLSAVIDVSLARYGRELPVVVVGESLGAAVALQAAAKDQRIKLVVAGASFSDLKTVVDDKAPFFLDEKGKQRALEIAQDEARFSIADASPAEAATRIKVPVLLLHGSEDAYLPMKHSLKIYESLAGPRRFVRLEGVGHVDILLSDAAWDEVESFVNARLEPSEEAVAGALSH
ncbi:MAG: alpha/beta fold hydrolase [Archangium sp.]|nr:alpha/beta fold hydrolase [Archangium sp.]